MAEAADRLGFVFYAEGQRCERLVAGRDPQDQAWEPFQMADLHPAREATLTLCIDGHQPADAARAEAVQRAVTVVEWMRDRAGWEGFDASLWLERGVAPPKRVFRWELV